ncbi:plant self-incompatibility protein S1 family [Striga asiatica]|uniref:S-protein homolog n=1 Tax=Striga asiatica TaxID=4170 RepID=A0A5A7PRB0_STRAF|nr:plant self-incompatibility protein S1 family [Striga asiatica]
MGLSLDICRLVGATALAPDSIVIFSVDLDGVRREHIDGVDLRRGRRKTGMVSEEGQIYSSKVVVGYGGRRWTATSGVRWCCWWRTAAQRIRFCCDELWSGCGLESTNWWSGGDELPAGVGERKCLERRQARDKDVYYDVRVINGFSNNSSVPLVVWCVSRETGDIGGRALQERDDYSWDVEPSAFWSIRDHEFVCTVKWDRTRKSFKAFDGSRDRYKCGPRRLCLWMVKEDGFYFSNDGVQWIKDFPWM